MNAVSLGHLLFPAQGFRGCESYLQTLKFQALKYLLAVGRAPNIAGLNLEAASVRVEKDRIPTDAVLRTSAPHIYACACQLRRIIV